MITSILFFQVIINVASMDKIISLDKVELEFS